MRWSFHKLVDAVFVYSIHLRFSFSWPRTFLYIFFLIPLWKLRLKYSWELFAQHKCRCNRIVFTNFFLLWFCIWFVPLYLWYCLKENESCLLLAVESNLSIWLRAISSDSSQHLRIKHTNAQQHRTYLWMVIYK